MVSIRDGREWRPGRARGGLVRAVALLVSWTVLLAVVIGLGLLITGPLDGSVGVADRAVADWFVAQRTSALDSAADLASSAGSPIVVLVVGPVAAVLAALGVRSVRPFVFLATALVGELTLYLVSVGVVGRHRPSVPALAGGLDPTHSYPSGHAAAATALYVGTAILIWAYLSRRWRPVATGLCVLPPLVAVARLYQGVHHLSDVLVGVALGLAWLAVTTTVVLDRSDRA